MVINQFIDYASDCRMTRVFDQVIDDVSDCRMTQVWCQTTVRWGRWSCSRGQPISSGWRGSISAAAERSQKCRRLKRVFLVSPERRAPSRSARWDSLPVCNVQSRQNQPDACLWCPPSVSCDVLAVRDQQGEPHVTLTFLSPCSLLLFCFFCFNSTSVSDQYMFM